MNQSIHSNSSSHYFIAAHSPRNEERAYFATGLFTTDKSQQLGQIEASMASPDKPSHQGEKQASVATPEPSSLDGHEYPTGLRLAAIIASIFIAMFLVALVRPKLRNTLFKLLTSMFTG